MMHMTSFTGELGSMVFGSSAAIVVALLAGFILSSGKKPVDKYPASTRVHAEGRKYPVRGIYAILPCGLLGAIMLGYFFVIVPLEANVDAMLVFQANPGAMTVITSSFWSTLVVNGIARFVYEAYYQARLARLGTASSMAFLPWMLMMALGAFVFPLAASGDVYLVIWHHSLYSTGNLVLLASMTFGMAGALVPPTLALFAQVFIERRYLIRVHLVPHGPVETTREIEMSYNPRGARLGDFTLQAVPVRLADRAARSGASHDASVVPELDAITPAGPWGWDAASPVQPDLDGPVAPGTERALLHLLAGMNRKLRVIETSVKVRFGVGGRLSRHHDNITRLHPGYMVRSGELGAGEHFKRLNLVTRPLIRRTGACMVIASAGMVMLNLLGRFIHEVGSGVMIAGIAVVIFFTMLGSFTTLQSASFDSDRDRDQVLEKTRELIALNDHVIGVISTVLGIDPHEATRDWRDPLDGEGKRGRRLAEARLTTRVYMVAIAASAGLPLVLDLTSMGTINIFGMFLSSFTWAATGVAFYATWRLVVLANIVLMAIICLSIQRSGPGSSVYNKPVRWLYVPWWVSGWTLVIGFFVWLSFPIVSPLSMVLNVLLCLHVALHVRLVRRGGALAVPQRVA